MITQTTTGSVRPRPPPEVRDEVCRYAVEAEAQRVGPEENSWPQSILHDACI